MRTGFLEEIFDMSADFTSTVWDVRDIECGSIQFIWDNVDDIDGLAGVQSSNDGENFNFDSFSVNTITVDCPASTQMWEWLRFTTRYIRFVYNNNSITTGTGRLLAWGHPLRRSR